MKGEIRYCTAEDGVRVAYCVEGDGPALLICPMLVESFSLEHLVPDYEAFMHRVGNGRQLIRFDFRGTGLSQRTVTELTPEALIRDLRAVIDAAGASVVSIWAPTAAGPRAMAYAAGAPERVKSLILYGTFARTSDVWPNETLKSLALLAQNNWELAARTFAGPAILLGGVFAESTTGDVVAELVTGAIDGDVSEMLPNIQARTLVVQRIADTLVPLHSGQRLASLIPDAQLVTPQGKVHAFFVDGGEIAEAVNAFLDEDLETRARPIDPTTTHTSDSVLTVLFTDLVGHTEMMSRLGDQAGRDVLREHERITREVLRANGGTEVKTMGDGFMASFGSVTKAVECAVAIQRAFEHESMGASDERLQVRCGLNAGEPIEEDGDLFGATVILASRIAGKADGGEILVADTVRGLCSGKGFLFADRGEFVAKGFEEPVRISEVSWSG